MRLLVDTNVLTAYFGGDTAVMDALASATTVWASVIVIGELEAGFRGGSRYAENLAVLERFLRHPTVSILPIDRETSTVFGEIKTALRRTATPIPLNDIWIAAQALQWGAVVATYDEHFAKVPGVRLW